MKVRQGDATRRITEVNSHLSLSKLGLKVGCGSGHYSGGVGGRTVGKADEPARAMLMPDPVDIFPLSGPVFTAYPQSAIDFSGTGARFCNLARAMGLWSPCTTPDKVNAGCKDSMATLAPQTPCERPVLSPNLSSPRSNLSAMLRSRLPVGTVRLAKARCRSPLSLPEAPPTSTCGTS